MCFIMDLHRRCDIRRIDETEPGPPCLVEPIGQEAHAIAFLDFEIFAMRLSNIGRRKASEIVSVEEDRHQLLPPESLNPRSAVTWSEIVGKIALLSVPASIG